MTTFVDNSQWKIRLAVNRLHKKYHTAPFRFLTEADIQCALYAELSKGFSKKSRSNSFDRANNKLNDWDYQVVTIPLHAELHSTRRNVGEFVDLCIIEPAKFDVWVAKTKFSRWKRNFKWSRYEWEPKESIGIEIKFNYWLAKNKNLVTGKHTKNWKFLKASLSRDLKKLSRYKRGWLIVVDHHSLIHSRAQWRQFVDELIRSVHYGFMKKTLNAYYLSPEFNVPFVYKGTGSYF